MIESHKASINYLYIETEKAFKNFFKEKKDLSKFENIAKEIIKVNKNGFNLSLLSKEDKLSNHCLNVAIISERIGRHINLSEEDNYDLVLGALIHDIGKFLIPINILNKPAKLSKEEKEVVMAHTKIGPPLLNNIRVNKRVIEIIKNHHDNIKIIKKPIKIYCSDLDLNVLLPVICSLADITDAIISKRAYKKALPLTFAKKELRIKGFLDIEDLFNAIELKDI